LARNSPYRLFAKKSFNLGAEFTFIIICLDVPKLAPFINAKNLLQFVCLFLTEVYIEFVFVAIFLHIVLYKKSKAGLCLFAKIFGNLGVIIALNKTSLFTMM
tara:strand:+ start:454 stop:759 length:306 start_codon:yes stop_codon:yes gene_type:complete